MRLRVGTHKTPPSDKAGIRHSPQNRPTHKTLTQQAQPALQQLAQEDIQVEGRPHNDLLAVRILLRGSCRGCGSGAVSLPL